MSWSPSASACSLPPGSIAPRISPSPAAACPCRWPPPWPQRTQPGRRFLHWRQVPASRRGLVIRDLATALRERKADLATLLAIEVGKICSEAEVEIREMIDIADYVVGLFR
ncbi:aldehyde dehydrogenase family protein [Azospira oryzae]|uniref:aldehyde dehydrogenase family protein n=1 Tax=Azospira oryzae TaxID=146939 RepID=UPI003083B417